MDQLAESRQRWVTCSVEDLKGSTFRGRGGHMLGLRDMSRDIAQRRGDEKCALNRNSQSPGHVFPTSHCIS